MKRIRYLALALVLMASVGLLGIAQIGVQVSASASQACGPYYSHDLEVTWKISGVTSGVSVAITIGLPDGTSQQSSSDKSEGTISLPLEAPGGGSVSVNLQARSGGATASATASASLTPCSGPPRPTGPNLPELGGHKRDVENSLQKLLDNIFESRRPTSPSQAPRDGVSRDTVNQGRSNTCLYPVPTPSGTRAGQDPRALGQRVAPKLGSATVPPKGRPVVKGTKEPVKDKPMGVVGVSAAPPPSAKAKPVTKGVATRPPAAGAYAMRAKKVQARTQGASDQVAQPEYSIEFIDETGKVVAEVPITNISEIPEVIADDEIDLTVDPVLEMGPNGEVEEVFYTCIGKKFLVRKPDGTVAVECRGIEVVW